MAETSNLTGVKKVFNTIITIVMIVGFIMSLVFVWGDILRVEITTDGVRSVHFVGLNYFVYDGWKIASKIATEYNNSFVTLTVYGTLILSLIALICAVVIVYIFAIKGLVNGLKSLITRKDSKVTKYAAIVSLTLFGYYYLVKMLAFFSYGPGFYNDTFIMYLDTSWGAGSFGFFSWFTMILVLAYKVIEKFDTKKVTQSIKNILIAISFIFILTCLSNISSGCIQILGGKEFTLFDNLVLLLGVNLSSEAITFLSLNSLFTLISLVGAILLLVHLVKHFFFDKELSMKKYIAFMSIMAGGALIAMILSNPTVEALVDSFKTLFGYSERYVENTFSGLFTSSLLTVALGITSICLETSKEDTEVKEIEQISEN